MPRWDRPTPRQREMYLRAVRVLSRLRDGESFASASRAEHITPATARKYLGSATYESGGEIYARAKDSLARELPFLTPEGRIEYVPVRGGAEASAVGRYWHAVRTFAETGDDRELRRLRRTTFVDAEGRRHHFNFNRATLRELSERGRLVIDDFYP